jgi:cell division protein FtsZ
LLENISIDGAPGIIINVTGGADLSLYEVNEASTLITEAAHEDAEIIFGAVIDETLGDEIRVTVIATGFEYQQPKEAGHHLAQQMQDFLHRQPTQPNITMSTAPQPTVATPPQAQQSAYQQPTYQQPTYQQPVYQQQAMTPTAAMMSPSAQPSMVPPAQPTHQPVMPPQEAPAVAPIMNDGSEMQRKFQDNVQPNESGALPRDLLIAKARAFRDNQEVRTRGNETTGVNMDEAALEEARRLAREALRNPFSQNFEVPAFLRRKQQGYETEGDKK